MISVALRAVNPLSLCTSRYLNNNFENVHRSANNYDNDTGKENKLNDK